MMDICDPTNSWRVYYSTEFPTLGEIAVRLVGLAIQSADVERCCKVNKLVHSKSRNRLKNENVVMLLSCYVNMRLLRRFRQMRQLASGSIGLEEFELDGVGEDMLSSVIDDILDDELESDDENESDSEN
jgi:hAT family C-terminal dimerisation region